MKYEVVITYECNWNCCYCSVDTHNNKITEKEVLSKFDRIIDNSTVILSGGEIGLLREEFLLKIIGRLQLKHCIVQVNTNGLFPRKYPKMLRYIDKIMYHCTEDLEDSFTKINHPNVEYLLVVHDDNIHGLGDYMEKYKDTMFTIIPATNTVTGIRDAPELSWDGRFYILKKFGSRLTEKNQKELIMGVDYSDREFI